jgi:hypothetical protein
LAPHPLQNTLHHWLLAPRVPICITTFGQLVTAIAAACEQDLHHHPAMASLDLTEPEAPDTFLEPPMSYRIVDAFAVIKSGELLRKQQLQKLQTLKDRLDSIQRRLASLKHRRSPALRKKSL